jgi:hypothetical protein
MTHETMIGVLLAIPYFVALFKQSMERHMQKGKEGSTIIDAKGSITSTSSNQGLQAIREDQEETAHLVGHRSLLCGTIPELLPSSDYSCQSSQDLVDTIPIANTPAGIDHREIYTVDEEEEEGPTTIPQVVHIARTMSADALLPLAIEGEEEDEVKPSSLDISEEKNPLMIVPVPFESSKKLADADTTDTPRTLATEATTPTTMRSATLSASSPELSSPTEAAAEQECRLVDHVTFGEPETVKEDDLYHDYLEPPEPTSTAEYLKYVSKALASKAGHVGHSGKVGIAQALMELGNILLQQEEHRMASHVFKRAEAVQKAVIQETMQATASAMAKQSKYYKKCNNSRLAKIYGNMAKELYEVSPSGKGPSPLVLKRAITLHHEHKPANLPTATANMTAAAAKKLASLMRKLDRRIQRASAEAAPLGKILLKEALCAAQMIKR